MTEAGLREGIFFERLLGERELFDDVRAESVRNLAHRFEHRRRSTTCTCGRCRARSSTAWPRAGLHELGAAERELLWAACLLHDIGVAVELRRPPPHSHYLILNSGLPGFGPRELVLIGLIAR